MYHLKYATTSELLRLDVVALEREKQEISRKKEEERRRREEEEMRRFKTSFAYNRNPVVCWYNRPISEFTTLDDFHYATRAMNHAAARDERDKPRR
ncbi:hypothetical protein GUITHDRAFT_120977 [Guillardia theta CCMP2712]|uniref:Uncharacterized protein n=1 Tax=Guillardia theta (strain CCMP2712) TaxID=905079 RepID=L1I9S5_GUITC|nr:hypothetical protein GUITHDRAFT_120977 [Guillardia theta CCMP2712]EKX32827.1 hypothetical protein GUITHDRAFT_120977 [Guillardia theta CCMP2712]|eukprot:XP_005819807.1 hypothetical protein GUITHDRAFT_120977 [Guillardia theta CCMP2712]